LVRPIDWGGGCSQSGGLPSGLLILRMPPHKGVLPYNLLGKAYSWATLGGHSEMALITTPSGSRI